MTSFEPFILTGHKILDFSRRWSSTFESWTTENCFKPDILVWFWSGLVWFAFLKIFWRLGENNFYLIFTPGVFLPPGHEVKKLPGEKKRKLFSYFFFHWELRELPVQLSLCLPCKRSSVLKTFHNKKHQIFPNLFLNYTEIL